MPNPFQWSTLLGPLATLSAVLLAYFLGQRTYCRQKEHEMVRARYLEGGVDRFAANVEYALGSVRHNWARTLQILKLFRDAPLKEAADLAARSSFRLIEPDKIDLVAGYRVQTLTRDPVYGRAQGHLFGFANAAENFFVNDAAALIRLAATGEISLADQSKAFDTALAETIRYQKESDSFYKLFYRLQDLGRLLERSHLSLREIDNFAANEEVKTIGAKLLELFPPDQEDPTTLRDREGTPTPIPAAPADPLGV